MKRHFLAATAALAALAVLQPAFAQASYPERAIRMIVPFPPGGSVDPMARLVGQKLGELLGQTVIIDNRAGGNTSIGAAAVATAAPDGYTILFTAASTHVIHTMQAPHLPYDSVKDFAPVATISRAGYIIVVHPSMPATLREFIAHAKANPGKLNYASSGIGNLNHLGAELFNINAGVKTTHVPYKGGGPALLDLIAGRVQFMVTGIPSVTAAIDKGQVRALAYSTQQPDMPPVRTFAQYGLADFDTLETLTVLLAPARTPDAVIRRLSDAVAKILEMPDVKAALLRQKVFPYFLPPDQFGARMRADQARFARVLKEADVKLAP